MCIAWILDTALEGKPSTRSWRKIRTSHFWRIKYSTIKSHLFNKNTELNMYLQLYTRVIGSIIADRRLVQEDAFFIMHFVLCIISNNNIYSDMHMNKKQFSTTSHPLGSVFSPFHLSCRPNASQREKHAKIYELLRRLIGIWVCQTPLESV
jgi:hypothetical protein